MLTQIKLPNGLFEAEIAVKKMEEAGWTAEGIEHVPSTEISGPETWMFFRQEMAA